MTPPAEQHQKRQRQKPKPRAYPRTFILTVPLPPNLANGRNLGHWRTKNKRKQEYLAILHGIATECEAARRRERRGLPPDRVTLGPYWIPEPPAAPLAYAEVRFVCDVYHMVDDDNLLARMKWLLDWLKPKPEADRAGYIVDDRRPHLIQTIPEQRVMTTRGPRNDPNPQLVTLVLTERPAPPEAPDE